MDGDIDKARPAARLTGRKVKAVLEGATKVFLERGFASSSMDEVAAAAAVSKRTLYQYFPSKEALFMAVVEARVDDTIGTLEELTNKPGETVSLMALAEEVVSRFFRPDTLRLYRIIIAESGRLATFGRTIDETGLRRLLAEMELVLGRVAEQRGARLENPAFAADVFMSLMQGTAQMRALLGAEPFGGYGTIEDRVACFERAFGLSEAPAAPTTPARRGKKAAPGA